MHGIFNASRREKFGWLQLLIVFALLFCVFGVSGCATSEAGKAYDVLYTGALVYDTAMTYAGDQYRAGKLTHGQKDRIVQYARQYRLAVTAGQSALREYTKAELLGEDLSGSEKALNIALESVAAAQELLTQYIQLSSKGGDGL